MHSILFEDRIFIYYFLPLKQAATPAAPMAKKIVPHKHRQSRARMSQVAVMNQKANM
jgi:hypothetical protein